MTANRGPVDESEDLHAAGDRISELLDQLDSLPDRRAGQWAEELLRRVTDLYGAALERIVQAGCDAEVERGEGFLQAIAADDLVASLLLVHDMHPRSLRYRIDQALAALNSPLTDADVRIVHLDEETATLKLRMVAASGAPSLTGAMERRVREALEAAAPELEKVEIDRLLPATPVQLGQRRTAGVVAEVH